MVLATRKLSTACISPVVKPPFTSLVQPKHLHFILCLATVLLYVAQEELSAILRTQPPYTPAWWIALALCLLILRFTWVETQLILPRSLWLKYSTAQALHHFSQLVEQHQTNMFVAQARPCWRLQETATTWHTESVLPPCLHCQALRPTRRTQAVMANYCRSPQRQILVI